MKEDILLAMLTKADDYISGEDISQRLGVTRAAVWKYIEDLRRSGYVIEALPRRGYRLVARPDKLLPTEIRAGLTTDRFGHVVHYFPQIGSTNDQARQLARQGAAEGTIVVAEEQTAGRGAARLGIAAWQRNFCFAHFAAEFDPGPGAPFDFNCGGGRSRGNPAADRATGGN